MRKYNLKRELAYYEGLVQGIEESLGEIDEHSDVTYYKNLGYGFRIYYQKRTKGTLLSQNYCYYSKREDCVEELHKRLKMLIRINKDLLDFGKL